MTTRYRVEVQHEVEAEGHDEAAVKFIQDILTPGTPVTLTVREYGGKGGGIKRIVIIDASKTIQKFGRTE